MKLPGRNPREFFLGGPLFVRYRLLRWIGLDLMLVLVGANGSRATDGKKPTSDQDCPKCFRGIDLGGLQDRLLCLLEWLLHCLTVQHVAADPAT